MLSAFTPRSMAREHRSLIRQLCGYLWVGACRSPLLKPRQMTEFLDADALRSLLSWCSQRPG